MVKILSMTPTIRTISEKKLVGNRLNMSLANDKTRELWQSFMPRRKEITTVLSTDLFCMQVYDKPVDASSIDEHATFDKWAAVEVATDDRIPPGMDIYTLPGGLYAVFIHKGAAATGPKTFQYIFGTWLPASDYVLDDRPHVEVLGAKYKNDDATSEEEVWIPIKFKAQ